MNGKVEETIKRLRTKAGHPSTPTAEAETCSRLADGLERKMGLPPEAPSGESGRANTHTTSWDVQRLGTARSNAVGRAYRQFTTQFDPQLWTAVYDRAVEAQRSAKVRFDPYLAFEHALDQYRADKLTDIRQTRETADAIKAHHLSDLELASELTRLTYVLLELQTKLLDVQEHGQRSPLFGRGAARNAGKAQAAYQRQYQSNMELFRHIETEVGRRSKATEPEPTPDPVSQQYRFFVNPATA